MPHSLLYLTCLFGLGATPLAAQTTRPDPNVASGHARVCVVNTRHKPLPNIPLDRRGNGITDDMGAHSYAVTARDGCATFAVPIGPGPGPRDIKIWVQSWEDFSMPEPASGTSTLVVLRHQ